MKHSLLLRDHYGFRQRLASKLALSMCLLVGPFLVLNGIAGLIFAGTEFNASNNLPRHRWNYFFEFNSWHQVLHIATGTLLVAASFKRAWAPLGVLVFGAIYAVLAPLAFIDGDDIANVVFSDALDNLVHSSLAAMGILLGLSAGALGFGMKTPKRIAGSLDGG